jgi:hypothetical protein
MAKTAASDPTDVPASVPEQRVDALYGLPIEEFTSARDALVKELRKDGRREDAEWVNGLRKPSAAAWVVNQLARTQASGAGELQVAAQALADEHARLMAGEARADDLRVAADRQGAAIAALLDKAAGLLDPGGHSPSRATLEKAGQTLAALALDDQTRNAFAAGRLTHESRSVGLGLVGATAAPAPKTSDARADDDRRERAQSEARRRAELRKALEAAKGEERTERRALERAEQEAQQARHDAERAKARLDDAEAELEGGRARHEEAIARVAELESSLEHLG